MHMQLFMLPFAGGSRYSLNAFRKCLPSHVKAMPVELPGRGARVDEPLLDNTEELVMDIYDQIRPDIRWPYAFYGHCVGGLLVFLLARKLVDEGMIPPVRIYQSGCPAPSTFKGGTAHTLSQDELRKALLEFGTEEQLLENDSFLEMTTPIIQADMNVLATYRYHPHFPIAVPITVILEKDGLLSPADALLWAQETSGDLDLFYLPGKVQKPPQELAGAFAQDRHALPSFSAESTALNEHL